MNGDRLSQWMIASAGLPRREGSPANSLHEFREVCWAPPELVDEVLRGLVYRHEIRLWLLRLPLSTHEGTNHDICRHWIRVNLERSRSMALGLRVVAGQAACRTRVLELM